MYIVAKPNSLYLYKTVHTSKYVVITIAPSPPDFQPSVVPEKCNITAMNSFTNSCLGNASFFYLLSTHILTRKSIHCNNIVGVTRVHWRIYSRGVVQYIQRREDSVSHGIDPIRII